jgi:hypothetical protein
VAGAGLSTPGWSVTLGAGIDTGAVCSAGFFALDATLTITSTHFAWRRALGCKEILLFSFKMIFVVRRIKGHCQGWLLKSQTRSLACPDAREFLLIGVVPSGALLKWAYPG